MGSSNKSRRLVVVVVDGFTAAPLVPSSSSTAIRNPFYCHRGGNDGEEGVWFEKMKEGEAAGCVNQGKAVHLLPSPHPRYEISHHWLESTEPTTLHLIVL